MPRGGQWVFVVLAGIVGAFYGASTTTTNQLLSDSWIGVKNTWSMAGFAAFLAALFFWNQNRKILPPVQAYKDPNGFPVLKWSELERVGGDKGILARRERSCWIAKSGDTLEFLSNTPSGVLRMPWALLESFMVTDENAHHGSRLENPHTLIVATFAEHHGQWVISKAAGSRAAAGSLHGLLTVGFIEARAEHLRRLKAEAVQAQRAAGAERPSEI